MLDERSPCIPCFEKSEASANRCLKMSFRWLPNMWIALVIAKYIMTLLEDSVGNELCGRCTFDLWSWSYYSALQYLSTRSHWYDPKDRCVSPFSSLLFIETPKWISKRESSDSLFTSSTLFKWRAYGPRAFLDWSYTLIFFNIMPSTLCSFLMIFIESMFPSCASTLMKSDLICPFSLPNGSWPCLLMYWLCSRFLFLLESSLFCSLPSLVLHLFGCIPSHCSCYVIEMGWHLSLVYRSLDVYSKEYWTLRACWDEQISSAHQREPLWQLPNCTCFVFLYALSYRSIVSTLLFHTIDHQNGNWEARSWVQF